MLSGFVSAVRTLSLLPIPGKDTQQLSAALSWFPLVGALVGGLIVGTGMLFELAGMTAWSGGVGFMLVLLSALLTRGLHLDGLADAADGLFSMTERARILAIMKDSRIGTFGALALMSVLGLKWVAVTRLVETRLILWILPAFIVSRTVMADLSSALPYARAEGGTGAPFVNGAAPRHRITAWVLAAVLLAGTGPAGLCALGGGGLTSGILAGIYRRRVGGITGDLLGAASELSETVTLTLFAICAVRADIVNTSWGALLRPLFG